VSPGLLIVWLIDPWFAREDFSAMLLNTFRSLAGQGPAGAAVALTWLGALRSHASDSHRSAGRWNFVWEKVCASSETACGTSTAYHQQQQQQQVIDVVRFESVPLQVLLSARASPEKLHDIVDVLSMHCITVSCCNSMQRISRGPAEGLTASDALRLAFGQSNLPVSFQAF
jgi:hypothetical protein